MRHRARKDANHAAIVAALRAVGVTVFETHQVHDGFPDLVAGYRGVNYLIEVKSTAGELTPAQRGLHADWRGCIVVAQTIDEALRRVGAL